MGLARPSQFDQTPPNHHTTFTMNRIALITGASRGLGKDMALRLAQTGCDIIITYQSKEVEASEMVAQIKQIGQKATALQFDVGEIKSFGGFIEKLQATLKQDFETDKLDILINNAGVGATIPIAQVTEEDFDRMVNIHFKGVYFLTQKLWHNPIILYIDSKKN
jgi:NAD(P)-dependent dehydrogenase (short-subunit alcohol dehydrogenase family)